MNGKLFTYKILRNLASHLSQFTEPPQCFIQWDSQSSKLEFYDFYKGSIIKQVFIENKGEYAINAVDFFITDSIIIFIGVEYLYIMDLNGNLISTIKLLYSGNPKENSPGNQIGTETIWLRMKSNFVSNSHYINEDENKIYFPIQRRNGFLNHQKSFKEESIIAEVNLNDKKIRYLDIFFPTEMDKFRFLGNDDAGVEYITPYISVDARNKRLFYTFPANSTIFSYTLGHKNSLKSFKINSSYTANSISIDKTSFNELSGVNKLLCNNPGFGAITYDPYRNLYYRIHRGSDDECKSLPFYITLINSEFEKIAEFKLNDKWHPRSYAVLPEGIYFKHKKINSLDTIYLSRVNIDNYINVKK